jgi:hypothetical protein
MAVFSNGKGVQGIGAARDAAMKEFLKKNRMNITFFYKEKKTVVKKDRATTTTTTFISMAAARGKKDDFQSLADSIVSAGKPKKFLKAAFERGNW